MGIGKRIKEARERLGLTQNELGELIGVTGSAITNYEKETSHPKEPVMYKLFEALHVDANYLFQDVVNVPSKANDVTLAEYEIIRKYRLLDDCGRKNVKTFLENEAERVRIMKEAYDAIETLKAQIGTLQPEKTERIPTRLINYYYRLASAGTGQVLFDMPPSKRIEIPNIPKYQKADYAIGVNGSSMEPVFHDSDILLVEMTEAINRGEIGIFVVNGESYVKKLGDGELISLNPDFSNIELFENSKCMGRVIGKVEKGNDKI